MRKFEISDRFTTADIGLAVEGDSLPELFQAAAEGMFAIILGPARQRNIFATREIALRDSTGEQLLVDWLSDLIYLFDAEDLVPYDYRIVIAEEPDFAVSGAIDFGRYETGREAAEHEIKAVTYYKLQIERTGGRYRCHWCSTYDENGEIIRRNLGGADRKQTGDEGSGAGAFLGNAGQGDRRRSC